MKALRHFLFGTLKGRLILGVAVVHAVMMTLFIADLTVRQRAMFLDRQAKEAEALSLALATSAAGWLAANDIAGLQELVDSQSRYPEIIFAMLVNREGQVLADTDPSRRRLYLLDLPSSPSPSQTILSKSPALVDIVAPAFLGGQHVGWARIGIGQKAADKKLVQIVRDGILYALAAILIGSCIAWLMGQQITRRLDAVQKTITAVRAGDLLARSSLTGDDEAALLAREFNHMLEVLVEKDHALREKTEELNHYFTDALDLLCIADTDGRFRRLNPTWEAVLGLPLSELEGRSFLDLVHPDDLESTLQAVAHLADQQQVLNFVNRYRHISGEYRWIEWRAFPSGQRIYAVAQDISERKRAEDALRFSEENLQRAQAVAQTGSWYLDIRNNVLTWSAETYRIFGIPPGQPLSLETFVDCVLPEDRTLVLEAWDAALRGGAPYDIEHRILVGEVNRWVRERAEVNFEADGSPLNAVGTVQDITERRQAERRLAILNFSLDNVRESAFLIGQDGRFHYVNQESCRSLGYSREELLGLGVEDVDPDFPLDQWTAHWSALKNQRAFTFEGRHQTKEGRIFPVEINANYFEYDGQGYNLAMVRDITERKKLEEQLHQAQKMEAIGTLAGGVAHDFNNMLSVIIGHTELALRQIDPSHPLLANLQEVRKAAGRSADLTRQLLTFARKQTVSLKVLDLNQTVEGMLKMLRRLVGEDLDLAWLPGHDLWPIRMDPSQLDQVLANLCVNARDAIAGVGKVTIETSKATIASAYCADHPEAIAGEYVLLAVSDNGAGMDRQTVDKIFEPFFTTKEMGKGTGLGLATVYGIIRQNKGFVNVYSEPGQGSTFKIYLPRHNQTPLESQPEKQAPTIIGGNETILLAEDEASILDMVQQILQGLGYRVFAASIPSEAIRLAQEHEETIHLLITDMVMPEMNGRELAQALLAIHPELKILYMSGYSDSVITRHGILDDGVYFLQKPFSMQDLAIKVREVFDGGSSGN